MIRSSLAAVFLAALLFAGCNTSSPSYPDAPDTAEAKKEIEAHDKSVDEAEKARAKAS